MSITNRKAYFILIILSVFFTINPLNGSHKKTSKMAHNKKLSHKIFVGCMLLGAVAYLFLNKNNSSGQSQPNIYGDKNFSGMQFSFKYTSEREGTYGELITVSSLQDKPISFHDFFSLLAKKKGAADFGSFLKNRAEDENFANGYYLRFPELRYKKGNFNKPCKFLLRSCSNKFPNADSLKFNSYFEKNDQGSVAFAGGGVWKSNFAIATSRHMVLISPNAKHKDINKSSCGDLASFVKSHGCDGVGGGLFMKLGSIVCYYIKTGNINHSDVVGKDYLTDKKLAIFISTSGHGVPWLHLRIDHKPEYYGKDHGHSHLKIS